MVWVEKAAMRKSRVLDGSSGTRGLGEAGYLQRLRGTSQGA